MNVAKFLSRITEANHDGCRLWIGAQNSQGYGRYSVGRYRRVLAHRIAYELKHGPIPQGLFVCHTCDVRLCVEVSHLFLGTPFDNMQDMARKGRSGSVQHPESVERGVERYCAKLDDSKVREIRDRKHAGESQRSLATAFGVNGGTISNIVNRKRWKHVK